MIRSPHTQKTSGQHPSIARRTRQLMHHFNLFWKYAPAPGGWVGIPAWVNGSSSSECTRLPARSTMDVVTKIHQIIFRGDFALALKELAQQRQIAQHRHLVIFIRNLRRDQAAEYDRLVVPYINRGHHFPDALKSGSTIGSCTTTRTLRLAVTLGMDGGGVITVKFSVGRGLASD